MVRVARVMMKKKMRRRQQMALIDPVPRRRRRRRCRRPAGQPPSPSSSSLMLTLVSLALGGPAKAVEGSFDLCKVKAIEYQKVRMGRMDGVESSEGPSMSTSERRRRRPVSEPEPVQAGQPRPLPLRLSQTRGEDHQARLTQRFVHDRQVTIRKPDTTSLPMSLS